MVPEIMSPDYSGVIVPLMPFLTPSKQYDFKAVQKQVECYLLSGVSGIFVLTTCGQAANFTFEENRELVRIVNEAVDNAVHLYVGIGRTKQEPDYPFKMIEIAEKNWAKAAVVLCPDYTPQEQLAFFKELNKTGFPLMAYSLGTGEKQLKPIEKILSLENVVGSKITIDLSFEENRVYFKRAVSSGKPVFIGEDKSFYDGLVLGAAGGVTAIANLILPEMLWLYQLYTDGSTDRAMEEQLDINQTLLSVLYYGKTRNGEPIDAAAALQCAMSKKLEFGGADMKPPHPTYTQADASIITDCLKEAKKKGLFGLDG